MGCDVERAAHVYRNALIDEGNTSGLTVAATDSALVAATRAELATGRWLNAATELYPATVLGTKAAERLGAHSPASQVWIAGQNFTVVGILQHAPLAPELDTMVLVGEDVARERLGFDGSPTTIFGAFHRRNCHRCARAYPRDREPESTK